MKTHKRNKRWLGMTGMQISVLAGLSLLACVTIVGLFAFIYFSSLPISSPQQVSYGAPVILSTATQQSSYTPSPSLTPRPSITPTSTFTPIPTATYTPSVTPTPTPRFTGNARSYIPDQDELPNDFRIVAGASGYIPIDGGELYQANFTNDYPNYHPSNDAYFVSYWVIIANSTDQAILYFDQYDKAWVAEYWPTWFDTSVEIEPWVVDLNVPKADESTAYVDDFQGASAPGMFVFAKIRLDNAVVVVKTLQHCHTNACESSAISQAFFFWELVRDRLMP